MSSDSSGQTDAVQSIIDMISSMESVDEVDITVLTGVDDSVIEDIESAVGGEVGSIGQQMSCEEIEELLRSVDYDGVENALDHLKEV